MRNDNDFAIGLMRSSYASYCYFVHKDKWKDTKFHTFLAKKVQEFTERKTGNPYDILVLSTPPQHGKSMTVTETFPSWYIGKYPHKRCLVAGYNDDFAGKFGRRNKAKIEEYGQFIFGISLSKVSDREMEIADYGGSLYTRGIMAGITGNSADLIIIDDPVKNRQEADSAAYRDRLWEEWQNSIKTRTQAGTKIIIIQTRWHEDDLAGRVIKHEKYVEVINIPVEAEENDILGRNVGDALCPEIGKDNAWLRNFKASYEGGMRAWNALFQGRPSSAEGNVFRRHWWRYYDTLPSYFPLIVISVDAAFKGNNDNDYVAIETWGKVNNDHYLLDLIKKQMDFPETLRAIKHMDAKYPNKHSIIIEDKANGPAIISTLRSEIPGIIPIEPQGGKLSRANAITGLVEAGHFYLPRYADFTDAFVEECAAFPSGAHDDTVDAFTQYVNKFKLYNAEYKEDNRTQFEKDLEKYKNKMLNGNKRRSYY